MAGAMNARGTTTHGILEGGGQERALRDRYRAMAAKTDTRWLRTSRVLRQLADHYHGQGSLPRRNCPRAGRLRLGLVLVTS